MDSKVDDNGNYFALTGSEDCTLKLSTVHANATDESAEGSKVLGNFFGARKVHRVCGILRRNGWELRGEWKRGCDDSCLGFTDAKSARRARTRESRESVEMGAKLGDVIQVREFSFLKSSLRRCRLFLLLLLNSSLVSFCLQQKGPARRAD